MDYALGSRRHERPTDRHQPGHADPRTRGLIRAADRAVLATADRDAEAWPFASLVLNACDHGAAPLMLLSFPLGWMMRRKQRLNY